jgi:hypothetical protein
LVATFPFSSQQLSACAVHVIYVKVVHAYVYTYTPSAYVLSEKRLELVFPSNNIWKKKKDILDTFFFEKIYLCVFNFSVFFPSTAFWLARSRPEKKSVSTPKKDIEKKKVGCTY